MQAKQLGIVTLIAGLAIGLAIGYGVQEGANASLRQNAKYWQQATAVFEPAKLKTMSDHMIYMTSDGKLLLAYHFDNLDLSKAQNLNWVAVGVPGKWCKQDQERVEKLFGPGWTHFHNLVKDTHGGTVAGEDGVWFRHTAVRPFEAPWGQVSQGIDSKFMPTQAPNCG